MTQALTDRYGITFENKILDFPINGKESWKTIHTNNIHLTNFFLAITDTTHLDELLCDVNEALASPGSKIEQQSATIDITIHPDVVDFYDRQGYVYTMPTTDFKVLIIGWYQFLLTPPLNGTKLK